MKHPYFQSLGPDIQKIADTQSIFSVAGVHLAKDPGYRSNGFPAGGKSRRQSMLL
jgi:hypothetical protein